MEEKEIQEYEEHMIDIDTMDRKQIRKKKKAKKEQKKGFKYELFDFMKTLVFCAIFVFLLTTFVVKPVRVDGKSMFPTLDNGEIGMMNVFSAKFLKIERLDVVVVYNEERKENWVKRVVGLPGDSIYAKNDVLYVNEIAVEEPYLDSAYTSQVRERGEAFTNDFEKVILKDDEYFLMGDNRLVSYDSRYVGPFKRNEIRGKDVYVFYPLNHMKLVVNGKR